MVDQKDLGYCYYCMMDGVLQCYHAKIEYGRRRQAWPSSAPLDMEYDNSITYYWSFKHDQSINQSSDLIYLEVSN